MFYSKGRTLLSNKLLDKGYIKQGTLEIVSEEVKKLRPLKKLRSIWWSFQTIWSSSLMNAKWHSVAWPNTLTTLHRSNFILIRDVFTRPFTDLFDVSIEHCDWCSMLTGKAFSSGYRVPSHVGLAYVLPCWDQSFPRTFRYLSGLYCSKITRSFLDFAWLRWHL